MKQPTEVTPVEVPDPRDQLKKNWGEPTEKLETIYLGDDPEKIV